jgi:hypothetical protein
MKNLHKNLDSTSVSIVDKASKDMAASLGTATAAIKTMGSALLGIAGATGFAKIIQSAADWNIQAQKMANTFGITTESASVFEVAIHSLGIEHDAAMNAALKLSRTLSQGTEKFDQYGISVKGANGNLLPMPEIMSNVNQALLETKSGADRNVMAMTLYGRSWGQLQDILRLTPEAMKEAQDTAERLHLIVGPEGVAKSYQYQKSIHEIELVGKSLAIQLGNELLPAIVTVTTQMGQGGVVAAGLFGKAIKEAARDTQEAVVYWTAGFDKLSVFLKNGGPLGLVFNKKTMMEQMKQIQETEGATLKDIAKQYDTPQKKSFGLGAGNTVDPGKGTADNGEKQSQVNAAYYAYEKSFLETILQLQTQANEAQEQANQIAYNWGLTDLKTYLDTKHKLNEDSLQQTLDTKKKELAEAQKAEASTLKAYDNPYDKTGSADVSKAYEKTQQAIMAVNAAEANLGKTITANDDESYKFTKITQKI